METASPQLAPHMAVIVDAAGIRSAAPVDVRDGIVAERFFWLDIFGGGESERTDFLNQLGLEADDITWAQRFGQTGRMLVGRKLRAVTWFVGRPGGIGEVHLLSSQHFIVTVRNGDDGALDEVRQRFSTRIGYCDQTHYQAAGILSQLLLGTLDLAIAELDSELAGLQARLNQGDRSFDSTALATWRDKWQSIWPHFERYSSCVRSAVVGVEVVPGMDARGAAELNDYADQVEDVEHRLHGRTQWLTDIMRDYATSIAQHQSDQISRLTVVTVIFLPITFLTGLFGMNFNWMINHIGSGLGFLVLGLVLPALSAFITLALFVRRGLLFVKRRPLAPVKCPRDALPVPPTVRPK
jgi:Mg2+ and Co2+ transporter CorA